MEKEITEILPYNCAPSVPNDCNDFRWQVRKVRPTLILKSYQPNFSIGFMVGL